MNSVLTGMPPIFPVGISMVFELATYGIVSGLIATKLKKNIYMTLIPAMLAGRIISGLVNFILFKAMGNSYTVAMFLSAAFVTALWGIVIQLIFIPLLVEGIKRFTPQKSS